MKDFTDMATVFWNDDTKQSDHHYNKSKLSQIIRAPKSVTIKPKPEEIPSFGDFLEFVLSTDLLGSGFSSHWVPYWRACTPCHFKYSGEFYTKLFSLTNSVIFLEGYTNDK